MYKKIPKSIKEDYNIDNYIKNIEIETKKKKEEETFEQLEKEIQFFLDCAKNDLYSHPNRIISKDERSKWRFKAKKFYKKFNEIKVEDENGAKATELLIKLYKILSYGSNYLIFTNWNTFGAIQVSQGIFYGNIIRRKLEEGATMENLQVCVDLLEAEHDPQGYSEEIIVEFEEALKTYEIKCLAIELLKEKVEKWTLKNKTKPCYDNEEQMNNFVKYVTRMYFEIGEVDKGIKYFQKNYVYKIKEIKEYILLEIVDKFEFYDEWIAEYEKYLGKINYREYLQTRYKELCKQRKKR